METNVQTSTISVLAQTQLLPYCPSRLGDCCSLVAQPVFLLLVGFESLQEHASVKEAIYTESE